MIKVAVVEDKQALRNNLIQVIQLLSELKMCFSAQNGSDAIEQYNNSVSKPDVILMDIEMPVMNGIEATRTLKELQPNLKIIILTVFEQKEKILSALRAGADGYLLKGEPPLRILEAVKETVEGKLSMSPVAAQATLDFFRSTVDNKNTKSTDDYNLTKREIEILELLTQGKPYKLIATDLFISEKTVRSHVENLYRKLEVHSKMEANNIAQTNRWFS